MRISREFALMSVAMIMSRRSTCLRKQVGAVLAREGRILSTGYAGVPSGVPHCHPGICNVEQPCTRTIHAEANAILYAARQGTETEGADLYTTVSPCPECAKMIVAAGIRRVYFYEAYRLTEGIDYLQAQNIYVEQVELHDELDLLEKND